VEGALRRAGGEILEQERELRGGLSEALRLTVAVPLLHGVPPARDALAAAIRGGGGITHRVVGTWGMYPGLPAPGGDGGGGGERAVAAAGLGSGGGGGALSRRWRALWRAPR